MSKKKLSKIYLLNQKCSLSCSLKKPLDQTAPQPAMQPQNIG